MYVYFSQFKSRSKAAILILASLMLLTGCSAPPKSESITMTGIYFDTVISVEVWGAGQDVLDQCDEICSYYEQLLSPTIESSEVSQINAAAGAPVHVSEETAELIRIGIEYGQRSGGLFDITVAPAVNLWDFHDRSKNEIPDANSLNQAIAHIDYRNILVEGTTVTLLDPQAQIDLGGIAKGYIADQLKEFLIASKVEHALINLGGNTLAVGGRYDGSDFLIGIQKPFADSGTVLAALSVSDLSVVSSGNYERYFRKDGVIYHHILDPRTGYPVQNELTQVTILSERSVDGDALSTTCFALGLEKGMDLIRSMDGVEAVFVTKDGTIQVSSDLVPIRKYE